MKTKMILLAALVSAAVLSVSSAHADVRFGVTIGVPAPVVVATPAPIYYAGPIAPAAIVEVQPACPGVDYVWAPGYWAHRGHGFIWMRGGWNNRAHRDYDRHGYDRHDNDRRYDHR